MSCFIEENGSGGKTAILGFSRENLLYDIKNYAWIEGDLIDGDEAWHLKHMVQDVGEEKNIDRVTRVLDVQFAIIKELLYTFTKHDMQKTELDNKLRETPTYGIVLNVPADFSQTTLFLMERVIHEYLVCRVMEDWMSIVLPEKAEKWRLKALEMETELKVNMLNRQMGTVRKLRPF